MLAVGLNISGWKHSCIGMVFDERTFRSFMRSFILLSFTLTSKSLKQSKNHIDSKNYMKKWWKNRDRDKNRYSDSNADQRNVVIVSSAFIRICYDLRMAALKKNGIQHALFEYKNIRC